MTGCSAVWLGSLGRIVVDVDSVTSAFFASDCCTSSVSSAEVLLLGGESLMSLLPDSSGSIGGPTL